MKVVEERNYIYNGISVLVEKLDFPQRNHYIDYVIQNVICSPKDWFLQCNSTLMKVQFFHAGSYFIRKFTQN